MKNKLSVLLKISALVSISVFIISLVVCLKQSKSWTTFFVRQEVESLGWLTRSQCQVCVVGLRFWRQIGWHRRQYRGLC